MGALLGLFNPNELKNFELQWKEADTSEMDQQMFEQCGLYADRLREMKDELDGYESVQALITASIKAGMKSEEGHEAMHKAMEALIPIAERINAWRTDVEEMGEFMGTVLFPHLCKKVPTPDTPTSPRSPSAAASDDTKEEEKTSLKEESILEHQALIFRTVQMLEAFLSFDQAKMLKPNLLNEFSFYKRSLGKLEGAFFSDLLPLKVKDDEAGQISMFLAHSIPTMRAIAAAIQKSGDGSVKVLAVIANACCDLLKGEKFDKKTLDHAKLAVRAMVAAFVMHDHASVTGSFQRRSVCKTSRIVSLVVNDYESLYGSKDAVEGLDSIVKYSTKNAAADETPGSIKRMLDL